MLSGLGNKSAASFENMSTQTYRQNQNHQRQLGGDRRATLCQQVETPGDTSTLEFGNVELAVCSIRVELLYSCRIQLRIVQGIGPAVVLCDLSSSNRSRWNSLSTPQLTTPFQRRSLVRSRPRISPRTRSPRSLLPLLSPPPFPLLPIVQSPIPHLEQVVDDDDREMRHQPCRRGLLGTWLRRLIVYDLRCFEVPTAFTSRFPSSAINDTRSS